jgi:hypothetical protein
MLDTPGVMGRNGLVWVRRNGRSQLEEPWVRKIECEKCGNSWGNEAKTVTEVLILTEECVLCE